MKELAVTIGLVYRRRLSRRRVAVLACLLGLAGCAQDDIFGREQPPNGAMAHQARIAVVMGDILVGGAAADRFSGPLAAAEPRQTANGDAEALRRADFERQAELQRAQARRAMVEQRLFEQWRSERVLASAAATRASSAEIREAQRRLAALGLYRGRIDGIAGRGTTAAVRQFEVRQGLAPTGRVTPELLRELRRAR